MSKIGIIATLLLAGCFRGEPPQLGPDGVPVFLGLDFRHPAHTPYHCFRFVGATATETSSCAAIPEWCAQELRDVQREGGALLGGCVPQPETTCLTYYSPNGRKTICFATPAHCEQEVALLLSPRGGARRDQLTACTPLDASWQPAE